MNFPIRKFLSYYKPYLNVFLLVLACATFISLLSLAFPLLVRYVTHEILENDLSAAFHDILWVGCVMIVLVILQNAGNFFVDFKGHEIGARMESDLRSELFSHMQKLSLSFYDKQKTGQLMTRITNDLLLLSELYHHAPEDYVKYSIRFLGSFIILLYINVPLTIAVFCFLPVLGVLSLYFNKKLNRALTRNKERIGDVNAQIEDSLGGIRVVQSFANEELEIGKFNRENQRFLESRKGTYKAEAYFFNTAEAFVQMITITVVVFGAMQILDASMNLADLITFLLYIGFMVEPMQKLTHMSMQFQEGITGFQRFLQIMNTKPEIENQPEPKSLPSIDGQIEFKDVCFHYNDRTNTVIDHLSLTIHPGEYVAIVGFSGAGKTTLASLIPRFYEVTEGEVLLDGENIRELDLHFLRKGIGVVQQDVYLFSGSVMDNIRYGNPEASDEEVILAAHQANAHSFITDLPDGYHAEIGQRGVRLSGGQKQRLSIARVFLKNPPILILDEATSALDNESEGVVKEALDTLVKGRTTIVIAHRLSTIRNAGRIIVLSKGKITEQGSHEELLRQEGSYSRLYSKQFEGQVN
ncbi:ABC transporter ATP-binding protein [Jeotgalibacillus proteolyticus]|uniref:Thiamine ABC transporter permease n=1 Tax=Jeotgalibacillus proteolyticus TaxID=2082395 RepID=A0A2S5GDH2_9BACL|nr:ABC transporter ATP-binding protein [Jeotgalibacillus proteolyticus]PPA71087.1 thiamine ABC transporter permease [Jeotgalibacillus proteolyticus]